jgi:uncharacterized RmlC-like cupin family protein
MAIGEDCVLISSSDRTTERDPTPGMNRTVGVSKLNTPASKVWIGYGVAQGETISAKHHHGEAETASYIISGSLRVYWGEGYEQYIEAHPGDFLYVPSHIHHYEECLEDVATVVSRSPDNLVYNFEDGTIPPIVVGEDCALVHPDDRLPELDPTPGMHRVVGISDKSSSASKVWMGYGEAKAGTTSAKHHHGEAETASYILSGRQRVYWGDDYEQYIEATAGDFLFVPSEIHHYEECLEDTSAIVMRSPDNIVVSLDA